MKLFPAFFLPPLLFLAGCARHADDPARNEIAYRTGGMQGENPVIHFCSDPPHIFHDADSDGQPPRVWREMFDPRGRRDFVRVP